MPLIKPYIDPSEIEQALIKTGVLPDPSQNSENDEIKNILAKSGISLENLVENIGEIATNSKFDNSRLKASELLLDLHGVRDKEGKNIKQPVFNFVIKSENVNLGNVFNPHSLRENLEDLS